MSSLLVAVGGAAGALIRHVVIEASTTELGAGLPWSTLAVNLAGSLLLGAVLGMHPRPPAWVLPLVAVGVCGALTTFSTFAVETVELTRADRWPLAAAYVGVTVVGAVAALLLGRAAVGWSRTAA